MGRINRKRINLGALDNLIKDLKKNVSIKVGIFENAHVEGTNLSYADLGAVHEFGATIKVTEKMRKYLHLKSETTEIVIPTRSFLRMPILSPEGKKEIMNMVKSQLTGDLDLDRASRLFEKVVWLVANQAYLQVLKAFETGGFGKWAPISPYTAERRENPSNPPLTDTGRRLKTKITYKIEGL